jgi:preprotein translocase subunit SecE
MVGPGGAGRSVVLGCYAFRRVSGTNLQCAAEGSSSIGRASVSKTGGWGFESLLPCSQHPDGKVTHVRINRKQRRSSQRTEDVDALDDPSAGLEDDGGAPDDEAALAPADLSGIGDPDDLDPVGDLDDVPVRRGGRASGDTMVGDRVARPRPAASGPERGGIHPRQFLHEVNVELRKVAWPTRKETINYSSVVLVTLSVLMALIFGLDYGFDKLSIYLFK